MKKFSLFLMTSAALMIGCTDYQGEIESAHEEFLEERSASNCACVIDAGGQIIKGGRIYWKLNCQHSGSIDFIDIYDTLDATHSLGDYHQDGPDRFYLEMTNELSGSLEFVTPYIDVVRDGKYSMTFKCVTVPVSDEDYYNSSSSWQTLPDFESSSSLAPLSSSSARSSSSVKRSSSSMKMSGVCGDLWCGPTDAGYGQVKMGFAEQDYDPNTSGWWYDITDKFEGGNSEVVFPKDVKENAYGNFFGPLVEKYKGIKATIKTGDEYEFAYAGIGFNLVDDQRTGADISDWEGLCLVYLSNYPFRVELIVQDEGLVSEYDRYYVNVPKSPESAISSDFVGVREYNWDSFNQEGWGIRVDLNDYLKKVAAIQIVVHGTNRDADIFLQSIGKYGTCK